LWLHAREDMKIVYMCWTGLNVCSRCDAHARDNPLPQMTGLDWRRKFTPNTANATQRHATHEHEHLLRSLFFCSHVTAVLLGEGGLDTLPANRFDPWQLSLKEATTYMEVPTHGYKLTRPDYDGFLKAIPLLASLLCRITGGLRTMFIAELTCLLGLPAF
jgi:hypothetical protein